jgi:pyroglutamyl-peptidase
MKLLLTGFEPFLGEKINPSQLLVEAVAESGKHGWVDTKILPVSFNSAPEILLQKFKSKKYDGLIMLGQASGRSLISLERVALNWVESRAADETGFTPATGPIDPRMKEAYFSSWPLGEFKKHLESSKVPVEISFSAGGFVCNYLYFKMASAGAGKPCMFMHVPYLPEQTVNKPDQPSMEFSVMKKGLFSLLEFLKEHKPE